MVKEIYHQTLARSQEKVVEESQEVKEERENKKLLDSLTLKLEKNVITKKNQI